jgi:predicted AAA+ superfamily ATPase
MNLAILRKISAQILSKDIPPLRRKLYGNIDFSSKLIGIKGARGAGKSTILQQYASSCKLSPSKILFVSCDHPAMAQESLYDVAEAFYARGGKLFIIDEIHKTPQFSQQLKAIYDLFDLQIIFSGSSALKIEHEKADLSRRAVIHHLGILSLSEFVSIQMNKPFQTYTLNDILQHHYDIAADILSTIKPLEQLGYYLEYGCYPFYLESIKDYPHKLLEVVSLTIDNDLCGIFHIAPAKLVKLKKILYMLCTTSPYELNVSKLSSAVGASWLTLSKYLERMDAGSLIHIVRGGTGMRAVNKPDKLLLDNPNLFNVLCAAPNIGSVRESFFVSSLVAKHQIHYHDRGDFIVDDEFVFEIGGRSKNAKQLDKKENGYIAADDIEIGDAQQIPLWMFGFLDN